MWRIVYRQHHPEGLAEVTVLVGAELQVTAVFLAKRSDPLWVDLKSAENAHSEVYFLTSTLLTR